VGLAWHNGSLYALSATCTHAGIPLDEGKVLADGCIRCPWPASSGSRTAGDARTGGRRRAPLEVVKVEGRRVCVRSVRTDPAHLSADRKEREMAPKVAGGDHVG
jgi:nitrite reductase/ring-hydroxylating ferredoxin subunit